MNLIPLVSSNFRAARMRPMFPSLIRSDSDTPWFWYFFATATTKRRFERTSVSSAPGSPSRMARARRASSSRSISGYALISRRYWSSDSDSAAIFLGGLNDMEVLRVTERRAAETRFYPVGTAAYAVCSARMGSFGGACIRARREGRKGDRVLREGGLRVEYVRRPPKVSTPRPTFSSNRTDAASSRSPSPQSMDCHEHLL